jgi:ATP-dependent Lhr-like helicase
VLRILKQRSLAALRKEVEPADAEALGRFVPAWQGVADVGAQPTAGGLDRLYEVIGQLQGVPVPASVLERDVLASRVRNYAPRLLDDLLAAGEVMWVGAGSLGRDDGRIVLALRDQAAVLLPRLGHGGVLGTGPGGRAPVEHSDLHEHLRSVLGARGACFFRELGRAGTPDTEVLEALWDLVWAGEVTGDGFAAVRATTGSGTGAARRKRAAPGARGSSRSRPRLGHLSVLGPPRGQGRWSLVGRELDLGGGPATGEDSPRPVADPRASTEAGVAVAGLLLERHGILTREAVRGEGVPGGFAGIYPVLRTMEEAGRIRRGYFVAGMGGAQFALPGAVDRLRSVRDAPAPLPAPGPEDGLDGPAPDGWAADGFGDERWHPDDPGRPRRPPAGPPVLVLAATDPANAYGLSLPWPRKGPSRVAGAYVIFVEGRITAYLERGGRGLVALREFDGQWEEHLVAALSSLVTSGRWSRLALERYPDELEAVLRAGEFTPTPKGLVRYGA